MVLSISKQHSVRLNYGTVPMGSLGDLLKVIFSERYDHTLFVRADPDITFREVLDVLDQAQGAVPDMHFVLLTPGPEETAPCFLREPPDRLGMNRVVPAVSGDVEF
jgi:hypothetical protein